MKRRNKKKSAFLKILAFLAMLVLPSLVWGFVCLFGLNDAMEGENVEKREKYTFKDVSLSNFSSQFEKYYNDRVPFRSSLISLNSSINSSLDTFYVNNLQPFLVKLVDNTETPEEKPASKIIEIPTKAQKQEPKEPDVHVHSFKEVSRIEPDYEHYGQITEECSCGETRQSILDKPVDTAYFPYKVYNDNTVLGRYNWLFYKTCAEEYQYANPYDEATMAKYAAACNNLLAACELKNKQLIINFIPNKTSIYSEYLPTLSNVVSPSRLEVFVDYMNKNTNAVIFYPKKELLDAKPFNQLYFKYDTHWNVLGAQVSANVIFKYLNLPISDSENTTFSTLPITAYDLFSLGGLDSNAFPPDAYYVPDYRPEVKLNKLSETTQLCVYSVDAPALNKTLTLFGDSYRAALSYYLYKDFSKTYVIDRVAKENASTMQALKESDIIILNLVERNLSKFIDDAVYLTNVINTP